MKCITSAGRDKKTSFYKQQRFNMFIVPYCANSQMPWRLLHDPEEHKVKNDFFSRPSEKRTLEWNSQRVTLSATKLYFQCQGNLSLKHICQGLQAFFSEIVPHVSLTHHCPLSCSFATILAFRTSNTSSSCLEGGRKKIMYVNMTMIVRLT